MLDVRRKALLEAALMCSQYADSLFVEKPEFAEVAWQCSALIEEASEQAHTITDIGSGSCQEVPAWILKPEIDYTSGLPRK